MDSVAGVRGSGGYEEEEEGLDGQAETDVQMTDIGENLPLIPIPHPSSPSDSVSSASAIEEVDVSLSARRALIPTVARLVRVMGSIAPVKDIVRVASQVNPSVDLAELELMVLMALASERCFAKTITEAVIMANLLDPTGNLGVQQAMSLLQQVLDRQ